MDGVQQAMRITKPLATECPNCKGIGYTIETAPQMHTKKEIVEEWVLNYRGYFVLTEIHSGHEVEYATVYKDMVPQVGSGCPRCHGTGQLQKRAA
jgi:DnaJ-class molecular chaperone